MAIIKIDCPKLTANIRVFILGWDDMVIILLSEVLTNKSEEC